MATTDTEYQSAVATCETALAEFQAVSSVIDTRMLTGVALTTAEFLREERARSKLILARRRLFAMPWYTPPRVKPSAVDAEESTAL